MRWLTANGWSGAPSRPGGNILAGDQAGEPGQHPGQSRSGDRHHGCRGVGSGRCERYAAHLRWLPRRRCPGASANRRDLLEPSCGRVGLGGEPRIRQGEAVPDRQSTRNPRPVPGPTIAVAVVILARAGAHVPGVALAVKLAQAVEIALAVKLAQAVEIALAVALAIAFDVARVIPVGDALMPTGLTWASI